METQIPTTRQMEVLTLIAEGLPNKHIATSLGISENTVEHHIQTLYQRLQVHNRVEATIRFWQYESTGHWC